MEWVWVATENNNLKESSFKLLEKSNQYLKHLALEFWSDVVGLRKKNTGEWALWGQELCPGHYKHRAFSLSAQLRPQGDTSGTAVAGETHEEQFRRKKV